MDVVSFFVSHWHFSARRIYWLFLAVAEVCLALEASFSQEINAYKTIGSGNFPDISIWAVWDGSVWNPATVKPGQNNDIYIDQGHTLTLTGNEAVKGLFINADTGAGQKLNLSGFNLDIYGSLRAFTNSAPGLPNNATNSQNWIGNSLASTLTFKGVSRVLVHKDSWSGQTTMSRFSVVFEPDNGQTLSLESPLKTLSFTVRSGTLLQKLDTSVAPNVCNTLSFNTETTVFGIGPYGNMTIESGATFISECNAGILNRSTSGSISSLNFDLQSGGTLILEGSTPRIEAANFQLNGKVIFSGGSTAKTYLASSYADATAPISVRDIELQGNYSLTLPSQLTLLGNLEKSGAGNFNTSNTSLTLAGSGNQEIIGFALSVRDLTLNKPAGIFLPNSNLTVLRNLTMAQGTMDLGGDDLSINTGLSGTLSYTGGSWKNVGLFTYHGIPSVLDGSNATFPFEDTRNGGLRKVQLLGNSPGGNLSISFTEYEGAEYNSGFQDVDNTDILYRLFSYFNFSGFTPSSNNLELRISAHQLIVDNVDDLRIVGTGYAAPGSHLPGQDNTELWARRSLTFADLAGVNFTVGSYRTLSILPIEWLETSGKSTNKGITIAWKVAGEYDASDFEIYRNLDPRYSEWEKAGTVYSQIVTEHSGEYQFLDQSADRYRDTFYRIRKADLSGNVSWSPVVKVTKSETPTPGQLILYPNPYTSGHIRIVLPADFPSHEATLSLHSAQGKALAQFAYGTNDLEPLLQNLAPGIYYIRISTKERSLTGTLIRK